MAANTVPWRIDIDQQVVEVYRGPNAAGYQEKNTCSPGDHLSPQALPAIHLSVVEILSAAA